MRIVYRPRPRLTRLPTLAWSVRPWPLTSRAASSKFERTTGPRTASLVLKPRPTANQWQPGSRMTTRTAVFARGEWAGAPAAGPAISRAAAAKGVSAAASRLMTSPDRVAVGVPLMGASLSGRGLAAIGRGYGTG